MSDRDEPLKTLLKTTADSVQAHRHPVDVDAIVGGRRVRAFPKRAARRSPARTLRRLSVAAFLLVAGIIVITGVRALPTSRSRTHPPASQALGLAGLEREYPHPVAIALSWLKTHHSGDYAAPTLLPGVPARSTPYVSATPDEPRGAVTSWAVALVRGGSGRLTMTSISKRAAVVIRFGATTYPSRVAAYRALTGIEIRPRGAFRTVTLVPGVTGYLHSVAPSGGEVYWLQGSWQLLVARGSTDDAMGVARILAAYVSAHPYSVGPGVLVASTNSCTTHQLLSTGIASVTLPGRCDPRRLVAITNSVREVH